MTALPLELDAAQGRLVIEALAELPFKTVFDLIGRLNSQAHGSDAAPGGVATRYALSGADLALIVGALGRMPYQRVHALMADVQRQVADYEAGQA